MSGAIRREQKTLPKAPLVPHLLLPRNTVITPLPPKSQANKSKARPRCHPPESETKLRFASPAHPGKTRKGAGHPRAPLCPRPGGRCLQVCPPHRETTIPPRTKALGTVAGFKQRKESVCFFISVEPTLITRNRCSRAETTCCLVLVK